MEIAGQTYRMATPYEDEYMQKISSILNDKLTATMKAMHTRSSQQALILVALDIIDEYLQIKDKTDKERSVLKGSIQSTLKEVNEAIADLEQKQG